MKRPEADALNTALVRLTQAVDEAERFYAPPSPEPEHAPLELPDDAFLQLISRPGETIPRSASAASASDVLFPDLAPRDYSAFNFDELSAEVSTCRKCRLCSTRTHTVFGEGQADHPVVMVIGEGPGRDEDLSGRPFVGKGGQYMDRWLAPIGISRRTNAFIANIVKCRPPQNRDPMPDEVQACIPYLRRQIELVRPRFILLVGAVAAHAILETREGVGALRGRTFSYMDIPVIVTYHPAGVLRNLDKLRAPVWEDMKRLATMAGLPVRTGRKST